LPRVRSIGLASRFERKVVRLRLFRRFYGLGLRSRIVGYRIVIFAMVPGALYVAKTSVNVELVHRFHDTQYSSVPHRLRVTRLQARYARNGKPVKIWGPAVSSNVVSCTPC